MNEIQIYFNKPIIPEIWDQDESIKKVKGIILRWKDLNEELAQELWIARENLAKEGRPKTGTKVPVISWDQYCEEIGSSKRVINRWLKRWFQPEIRGEIETPLFPPGKFPVIYADPPWQYSNSGFDESVQSQYPTMPEEKIANLKDKSEKAIKDLSYPGTVLFLWATNPLIPEAIQVLEGWGFQYKTNMAWIKDRGRGKGWWLKSKHELLFIGVKVDTPKPVERFDSCFQAKRESTHSKKPEIVHEFIQKMYPGPLDETFYLELFARKSKFGWKAWGNEIL